MSLVDLDPPLLRAIFSRLSLADLLRLHRLHPSFAPIQCQILEQVDCLTILLGEEADQQLADPVFTIPHLEELEGQQANGAPVFPPGSSLEFDWLDAASVRLLQRFLPSVAHLQVSFRSISPTRSFSFKPRAETVYAFDSICVLLECWSRTLHSVRLFACFDFQKFDFSPDRLLVPLFAALDNCSQLQSLALEILNPFYYPERNVAKPQIDLPILKNLRHFHINFADYLPLTLEALQRHGLGNASLETISLGSLTEKDLKADFFTQSELGLLHQKIHLVPYLILDDPESEHAQNFCRHFTALKKISIGINDISQTYAILAMLEPLSKLIYLDLNFYLSMWHAITWDASSIPLSSLPRLPSVRILNVNATLHSHTDLHRIPWRQLFPNLEILEYTFGLMLCTICREAGRGNGGPEDEENSQRECVREGLKAWQDCPKLNKIYGGFSWDINQWRVDPLMGPVMIAGEEQ